MLAISFGSMVLNSLSAGLQAGMKASSAKYQYDAQALSYDFKAKSAELNKKSAAYDLIANQLALQRNTAVAGMKAGQQMAATRNATAASGVAMDSASKYEVMASERYNQAIDLAAQEQNRMNQYITDRNKMAAYDIEAMTDRANAQSARDIGSTISKHRSSMAAGLNTMIAGVTNLASQGAFTQIEVPNVSLGQSQVSPGKTMLGKKGWFNDLFEWGDKLSGSLDKKVGMEIF